MDRAPDVIFREPGFCKQRSQPLTVALYEAGLRADLSDAEDTMERKLRIEAAWFARPRKEVFERRIGGLEEVKITTAGAGSRRYPPGYSSE